MNNHMKFKRNRSKLIKQCMIILDISKNRIIKQGKGCIVPDYGASYKYKYDRDTIGILLNFSQIKNSTYGEISEDSQKYLVNLISKKFNVNIDTYTRRDYFVKFLQNLQDLHDNSFDGYNNDIQDRMTYFKEECNKLYNSLNIDYTKAIQ